MIGGKIAYLRASGDAQAGRHRSLARRKERTHHQDQQMLPAWRCKPETKRRQPFAKDVGDRVSRLTATIMVFAHPSVRIRSNEWRKAGTCGELIHPGLLSSTQNHHRFCTKSRSEDIKASYAMLRNVVNVLPAAISDSFSHPDILRLADGKNKRPADMLNEAVSAMVSFTISPTPGLHDAVEQRLTVLERAAQPLAPEVRNAIRRFIAQIKVAVRERERGNMLMLAVTAVPTDAAAERVKTELQTLEAEQAGWQRRLWDLAVTLSGLLALIFVGFVYALRRRFAELDRDNRMLQQANEDVEQQLMQSTKLSALGQMVAGITHEINTPLAYGKAVFVGIIETVPPPHFPVADD
jgi:phosphoribosyl-dephospho-CoA transferase